MCHWRCARTCFDWNVKHVHEKLGEEHGIELSCMWVKQALQNGQIQKLATWIFHPCQPDPTAVRKASAAFEPAR